MRKINRVGLFLILIIFSVIYGAEELYLVVGSNRTAGQINNTYLESCYHNSETDFSHARTFEGRAITMDLRPDTGITNHIPATDICVFDFKKPIAAAFMELFPSEGVRTVIDLQRIAAAMDPRIKESAVSEVSKKLASYPAKMREELIAKMVEDMDTPPTIDFLLMMRSIKNLAGQMQLGGTLSIEHLPLISKKQEAIIKNPFSLYVYPLFSDLLKAAMSTDSEQVWSEAAERLSSQRVSSEEIEKLITEGKEKQVLCQQAIASVQEAMATSTGEICLDSEAYFAQLNEEISIFGEDFFDKLAQFQLSLSAVVAIELERLEQSQPDSSINKFLQKHGFANIQHERVLINSFNGRRNSWMITAVKA